MDLTTDEVLPNSPVPVRAIPFRTGQELALEDRIKEFADVLTSMKSPPCFRVVGSLIITTTLTVCPAPDNRFLFDVFAMDGYRGIYKTTRETFLNTIYACHRGYVSRNRHSDTPITDMCGMYNLKEILDKYELKTEVTPTGVDIGDITVIAMNPDGTLTAMKKNNSFTLSPIELLMLK